MRRGALTRRLHHATVAGALALAPAAAAYAQDEEEVEYEIEDKVEIHISGSHWQDCQVVENDRAMSYMRVKCKAYKTPRMARAAGVYMVSRNPSDVRRSTKQEALPAGAYKE